MAIGVLSAPYSTETRVVPDITFGSLNYSDPKLVQVLGQQGLKEEATPIWGGQIVTVLKMAWVWMCFVILLPVTLPLHGVRKVVSVIVKLFKRVVNVIQSVYSKLRTDAQLLRKIINKRVRAMLLILLLVFMFYLGPVGILVWMGIIIFAGLCFIPTDVRYYVEFKNSIDRAWALDDDKVLENTTVPKKMRNNFACRLAERAISKVGLLSNTKANALVYQKVILDEMERTKVRHADRVRVLPIAVAACLYRPEEVRDVERWVQRFVSPTSIL